MDEISSSTDPILQADRPNSSSYAVHRALQLIQSDDPDLKLQAAQEIEWLAMTSQSFQRQLSGSIEPLVSMLRVDSPESHLKFALRALTNLSIEDERNKIKIVEANALEPIISFLQSQSLKLQKAGIEFLLFLSTSAFNKQVIGSSSTIPLLVKILGHESQQAKMNAIEALLVLSEDPNNLNIILGTKPIPLMVDLLKKYDKSSEITEMCSALVESLVGFDNGRTALTSVEGGVLAVVEVLKNGTLKTKKHAVGALLTMCLGDRSKFREPTLKEGIISELEKITVPGEPKLLLKARTLLLLLTDSPYSQRVPRVTVYHVNNKGEWVEHGICYVSIDRWKGSKEVCLFVIAKEDQKSLLHHISPDDVYGQPQDKVIKWRDLKNRTHLALRFHETSGFSYIWDRICSVQTNPHFNTLNNLVDRISFVLFFHVNGPTLIQKKGKGLGNKQTTFYYSCKGSSTRDLYNFYGLRPAATSISREKKEFPSFVLDGALKLKSATNVAAKLFFWKAPTKIGNSPIKLLVPASLSRIDRSTRERNDTNSNVSSYHKVISKWIFVIANFILEIPSAAFDQLSSVQKPEYALIAMLMSFVAILICVIELIFKGQKERVLWRWKGRIPWFYHAPPSDKPFGNFADIVGLGCAIFQFVVTVINYSFICRNVDSPIKISVWPIIFSFGVLCSKFSENQEKTHQD